MIPEAIAATLSLDVAWWLHIIFANLFWVFGFLAIAYFFFGGKKMLSGFLVIVLAIWATMDFSAFSGWTFTAAAFLLLYYITRLSLLAFIESVPSLQKHILPPFVIQYISLLVFFNIFLRTW